MPKNIIFTKKHVKAGQSALLKWSNSMPETYTEARHHQSSAPPQTLPVTFNSSPTSVKCIDHDPQMPPENTPIHLKHMHSQRHRCQHFIYYFTCGQLNSNLWIISSPFRNSDFFLNLLNQGFISEGLLSY